MSELTEFNGSVSFFERRRRVRRVRMIVDLTLEMIRRDASITYREATSLVACARKAIVELMPQYEPEFEESVRPRLEKLIRRRWPLEDVDRRPLTSELIN